MFVTPNSRQFKLPYSQVSLENELQIAPGNFGREDFMSSARGLAFATSSTCQWATHPSCSPRQPCTVCSVKWRKAGRFKKNRRLLRRLAMLPEICRDATLLTVDRCTQHSTSHPLISSLKEDKNIWELERRESETSVRKLCEDRQKTNFG